MKCPHCFVTFDDRWKATEVGSDDRGAEWWVAYTKCSACGEAILNLQGILPGAEMPERMIWPRGSVRPVAPEVPDTYAENFREACVVLSDSTNASAAISRRCLQSLLVNEGGAKRGRLVDQIDEVVDSKTLRPALADNLHYVRKVGNLGAHETKNDNTGEVVDATQEEAEWLIEVLEGLFEHYFVEPKREQERREKFDARTAERREAEPAEPAKRKEVPKRTGAPGGSNGPSLPNTQVLGQGQSTQRDFD